MKKGVLVLVALVLMTLPTKAQAVGVEFALGGWSQSPSGNLAYKAVSSNDSIDLEGDLNYGTEFKFMGRLKLDMPLLIPNIYVMVTPISFSGTGSKSINFKFGDQTFVANTPFESEVTLNNYDFGLYYGIPFVETATAGMFNVDAGLNVRVLDMEAKITQAPLNESGSVMLPIPMIYLGAQFKPIDRIAAEGELRGISISGNSYYSLIGRLKVKVFGPTFAAAGYRYEALDVDESDLIMDVNIGGLFFEVGADF